MNEENNYVHQILKKKLDQLNKEKYEMDARVEQENEYIISRLSKQLHDVISKNKEYPIISAHYPVCLIKKLKKKMNSIKK